MCLERLVGVEELAIVIAAWLPMLMGRGGEEEVSGERWKEIAGEEAGRRGIFHSLAKWRSHFKSRAAREAAMNSDSALESAWAC